MRLRDNKVLEAERAGTGLPVSFPAVTFNFTGVPNRLFPAFRRFFALGPTTKPANRKGDV